MATLTEQLSTQVANQIGQENIGKFATFMNLSPEKAIIVLAIGIMIVLIWSLIWKGLALWKAAGKKHKIWFIIILIVNTIGILEILYIFVFSKISENKGFSKPFKKKK